MEPLLWTLWKALRPLQSVVSFMNSGAHPDDETSAMLAVLGMRDGLNLSYACANRGEGGQNDIGPETGAALGVLRTAEMERAAEILNLRLYWLGQSPDDPIRDFGFSKSGQETFRKWGRKRTLDRFVEIIRTERPDILCPTFLDVPGQHGHHRTMTEAAHLMMELASDPGYPGSDLPAWQISKLYLPAWSGAGQSYDDDLPPPPATLIVEGKGLDPISGWSYERIGQQSRAFHKTQGMGRWVAPGEERDWPLHLADSRVSGPDADIHSGLPKTVADLDIPEISNLLGQAQEHISAMLAAFPDREVIVKHGTSALTALRQALASCPEAARYLHEHRLRRKLLQISRVVMIAAGVEVRARSSETLLYPASKSTLEIETRHGLAESVETSPVLPSAWTLSGSNILVQEVAVPSDSYPDHYLPGNPEPPFLNVSARIAGCTVEDKARLETTPICLPTVAATCTPAKDIINLAAKRRSVEVHLSQIAPPGSTAAFELPDGWTQEAAGSRILISAPEDVAAGLYRLPLLLDGTPAQTTTLVQYPHTAPRALIAPATVTIRVLNAELPRTRVGYIGSGNDQVGYWLERLGFPVTPLSDEDLADGTLLETLDTIVIGIFAVRFRAALAAAMPRLHDWTEDGGTLLTLYHRPWDNWDPERIPPRRLEIGQPSLRWRVTDETADVRYLRPDHRLLNTPNDIASDDWAGWHKERGLYFAKSWDAAYEPLLEMADPGEDPLKGALLAAEVGAGIHIHTSLILHHQMNHLVEGAFRLIANLLAKR